MPEILVSWLFNERTVIIRNDQNGATIRFAGSAESSEPLDAARVSPIDGAQALPNLHFVCSIGERDFAIVVVRRFYPGCRPPRPWPQATSDMVAWEVDYTTLFDETATPLSKTHMLALLPKP